jgi:hypothetical protein
VGREFRWRGATVDAWKRAGVRGCEGFMGYEVGCHPGPHILSVHHHFGGGGLGTHALLHHQDVPSPCHLAVLEVRGEVTRGNASAYIGCRPLGFRV